MPDFGVTSLVGLIDGVKVLAFAVREGRVAVHCHAGLGRTGTDKHTVSVYVHTVCAHVMLACMVSVFDKIRLETVLISRRRNSIVTEGENTVIQ